MSGAALAALFPAEPFWIGGERGYLRPVVLAELRLVERVMAAWARLVARKGDAVDRDALSDLEELLAKAANRPQSWVQSLQEDACESLFAAVLALNQDLLEPLPGGEGEDLEWSQVAQRLLAFGHRMEDISGYTLAQTRAFLKETGRMEREQLANDIFASAHAMADGKHTEKAIKELRRGR